MKFLFVENHARFARASTQAFLAAHEVTVVPSLAEARTLLRGMHLRAYDVLLVGYDLDDGKGSTLVQELAGKVPRPLIIAVSSRAAGNFDLLRAGADAVCGKMRFAGLLPLVHELVGDR